MFFFIGINSHQIGLGLKRARSGWVGKGSLFCNLLSNTDQRWTDGLTDEPTEQRRSDRQNDNSKFPVMHHDGNDMAEEDRQE